MGPYIGSGPGHSVDNTMRQLVDPSNEESGEHTKLQYTKKSPATAPETRKDDTPEFKGPLIEKIDPESNNGGSNTLTNSQKPEANQRSS